MKGCEFGSIVGMTSILLAHAVIPNAWAILSPRVGSKSEQITSLTLS